MLHDIERLSVRPVKWLRFVTFAICGVRGHLSESAMFNGTPVDYDSISQDHLIDHKAMNDRIASEQTTRSSRFHRRAMALCASSQGPILMIAMRHTYSPKVRAMRYVSVVIVPRHHLAKYPSSTLRLLSKNVSIPTTRSRT